MYGRLASFCIISGLVGCASDPSAAVNGGGAAGSPIVSGGSGGMALSSGGDAGAVAGAPAGGSLTGGATGDSGGATGGSGGAGGAASQGGSTSGGNGSSTAGTGGLSSGAGGSGGQPAVTNAVESLAVRPDGLVVSSKASLDNGELFLLRATGTVDLAGVAFDAEYGGFTASAAGQDSISGADVGVDIGVKVERTPAGTTAGRKKWFGTYRTDHTYYVILTGSGVPLSLKLVSPAGTGTGAVTVSVFRLSPSAPALAPALETVMANVTKPTVRSTMVTSASAVYLLQAVGSGKTGGNNLGLGDADWMDWDADGKGKVDIGDQNVDYGLGVDESDPTITPRRYWWGPWRKDHSYYLLFAGTGTTIGFSYYDVGDYSDNSKTDKIPVHVFPLP